jgi:undecaprenyl-diphosphatase
MTIFQAIVLGVIQGLTEFLPISSSGHLVLVEEFLQWNIASDQIFIFNILVQMGTLVAVIYYFWNDLIALISEFWHTKVMRDVEGDEENNTIIYIIIATIPVGILGVLINGFVEETFSNIIATGGFLIFTAILMVLAEKTEKKNRLDEKVNLIDAILMGLFQAIAIFPGVSRSGSTISAGLFRGLSRKTAAKFSFLMSIPVMVSAGVWALNDIFKVANFDNFVLPLSVGFVTAAVVGYFSIRWLLTYLSNNSLTKFSGYLFVLGIIAILNG